MPRTKPSPGVPVRWSHPLAVGLLRAWTFGEPRGRDSGGWEFYDRTPAQDRLTYTRNNADTLYTDGPAGPLFQCGADGGVATFESRDTLDRMGWDGRSVSVVGRYQKFGSNPSLESIPLSGSGGSLLAWTRTSTSSSDDGILLGTSTGSVYWCVDGSGKFVGAKYDTTISSGPWYTVGGSFAWNPSVGTYGGTWEVYLDGQRRAANNYPGAGSFSGTFVTTPTLRVQRDGTSDKRLDYLYIWGRDLSPAEHAWLHDDPFDMFAPRRLSFVGTAPPPPATNNYVPLISGLGW